MISVLMTTYNCAPYISQAIKSILNQTYNKFEFLIIDDGSTDNTDEVVKSFQDERIRFIKSVHIGRSKALNYGLQNCSNDWVALMDSDDICHPQRIEYQLKNFDYHENSILCTWSIYFRDDKLLFDVRTPVNTEEFRNKMALHSYVCNPSIIFNRKFIMSNGNYLEELHNSEDYELWSRLLNKAKFIVCEEYLLFQRMRTNSLSRYDLVRTKRQVNFIHKKYQDLANHFQITDSYKQIKILGWREYFYGDRVKARNIWFTLGDRLIYNPKILITILFTYLNEKHFNWFWEKRLRLLIKFKLEKLFSIKIRKAERFLTNELSISRRLN